MELIFGERGVTTRAHCSLYIVISSSNTHYTPFAYRYSYGALGLLVRQKGCVGKYAHTQLVEHITNRGNAIWCRPATSMHDRMHSMLQLIYRDP